VEFFKERAVCFCGDEVVNHINGGIEVKHLLEFLYKDIGIAQIKKRY